MSAGVLQKRMDFSINNIYGRFLKINVNETLNIMNYKSILIFNKQIYGTNILNGNPKSVFIKVTKSRMLYSPSCNNTKAIFIPFINMKRNTYQSVSFTL